MNPIGSRVALCPACNLPALVLIYSDVPRYIIHAPDQNGQVAVDHEVRVWTEIAAHDCIPGLPEVA